MILHKVAIISIHNSYIEALISGSGFPGPNFLAIQKQVDNFTWFKKKWLEQSDGWSMLKIKEGKQFLIIRHIHTKYLASKIIIN